MREVLINLVKMRQSLGQTPDDIVSGMVHTICETLGLQYDDVTKIIQQAKSEKKTSDKMFAELNESIRKTPVINLGKRK